jgi:hypothetical protein
MTYLFDYMYICTVFLYTLIYTIIMTISTSSDILCSVLWKMNKRIKGF